MGTASISFVIAMRRYSKGLPIGKQLLEDGVTDFADWARTMEQELDGWQARPQIARIWEDLTGTPVDPDYLKLQRWGDIATVLLSLALILVSIAAVVACLTSDSFAKWMMR